MTPCLSALFSSEQAKCRGDTKQQAPFQANYCPPAIETISSTKCQNFIARFAITVELNTPRVSTAEDSLLRMGGSYPSTLLMDLSALSHVRFIKASLLVHRMRSHRFGIEVRRDASFHGHLPTYRREVFHAASADKLQMSKEHHTEKKVDGTFTKHGTQRNHRPINA